MNTHVNSLDEVRENIDEIDKQIVDLLGVRYYYVTQAARFKNSAEDVKAPARVEKVIAKVRELAKQADIEPDIVEKIYRSMIDCFINHELKTYHNK
jgi:isochorismate pyruvate lyase